MFASKDIKVGAELTFSYGESDAEVQQAVASEHNTTRSNGIIAQKAIGDRRRCYCKSEQCCGFLPRC